MTAAVNGVNLQQAASQTSSARRAAERNRTQAADLRRLGEAFLLEHALDGRAGLHALVMRGAVLGQGHLHARRGPELDVEERCVGDREIEGDVQLELELL